jgi:transposase
MIPIAAGARIWIVTGHTDMRKRHVGSGVAGAGGPWARSLCRRRLCVPWSCGTLIKALWHDGVGLSLYAKRLDRGRFIWPATVDGVVSLTAAQMGYLLEAIDWRNPQHSWRPQSAG